MARDKNNTILIHHFIGPELSALRLYVNDIQTVSIEFTFFKN